MSPRTRNIISGALVITLLIGSLNSVYKYKRLPNLRFFFGTGVLYLFLTGLGEFEEELSKSIAVAILVFVAVGEGGGVLDHFIGAGSSKTTLDTTPPKNHHGGSSGAGFHADMGLMETRPRAGLPSTAGTIDVAPSKAPYYA